MAGAGYERDPRMPDVPTVIEAGFKDYWVGTWFSIVTKAGTPRPIVERMNREMDTALKSADVRQKLSVAGLDPVGGTPEDLAKLMRSESDKWGPIIKRTGATVD